MPRVIIELVDIFCRDTKDWDGQDELFVLSAVSDSKTCMTIVSAGLGIAANESVTLSHENRILFDHADVQVDRSLTGGILLFECDSAKEYDTYLSTRKAVQEKANALLERPVAEMLDQLAVTATESSWFTRKDKLVGKYTFELPVEGSAEQTWEWKCKRGNFVTEAIGLTTWDYKVTFKAVRSNDLIIDRI